MHRVKDQSEIRTIDRLQYAQCAREQRDCPNTLQGMAMPAGKLR
jgi:hypothetical protein